MNKRYITIFILIVIALISLVFGISVYNLKTVQSIGSKKEESAIETPNVQNIETVKTNMEETKLSPNASLSFIKKYTGCGHVVKTKENVTPSMANLNEIEFTNLYRDWEILKFTNYEAELSKTFER